VRQPVRLGAVEYLNARPLVYGLDSRSEGHDGVPALDVRFDVPSVCAQLLADGAIDLGLIPSITYESLNDLRVVPGIGILSNGPVASVALFTTRSIERVRTLALDTSSRTSVALTRILCDRVFRINPEFHPHAPDLTAMLGVCDAALLIGDPALFAGYRHLGAEKIDLGEAWTSWTGLPFVWAFWAGRSGAADDRVVRVLQQARDRGTAASATIANEYCGSDENRRAVAQDYLQRNIQYRLDDNGLKGLVRFYNEAATLGLISSVPAVKFF
jgi:chorismate dehydratase